MRFDNGMMQSNRPYVCFLWPHCSSLYISAANSHVTVINTQKSRPNIRIPFVVLTLVSARLRGTSSCPSVQKSEGALAPLCTLVSAPLLSCIVYQIFNVEKWLGVIQSHWQWHHSINHNTTFYQYAVVSIALFCTIFELSDAEESADFEIQVRDHSPFEFMYIAGSCRPGTIFLPLIA